MMSSHFEWAKLCLDGRLSEIIDVKFEKIPTKKEPKQEKKVATDVKFELECKKETLQETPMKKLKVKRKYRKSLKYKQKLKKTEKTKEENYKTMPMQKSSWLARGVFKKRLGRLKEIFHTNQHSRKESI